MEVIAVNNKYSKIVFTDNNGELFVIGKEDPFWDGVTYACPECGCIVPVRALFQGEHGLVCENCIEAKGLYQCDYCGNYADTETVGTGEVCEECLSKYFTRCDHCDEWVERDRLIYVEGYDEICPDCFEDLKDSGDIFRCCECGRWVSEGNLNLYEPTGELLCSDCLEEREEDEEGGYIADYHCSRPPRFISLNSNVAAPKSGNIYLGMELELSNVGEYNDDLAKELEKFGFKSEHDSSINDGFETISDAMTFPFWKKGSVDIGKLIDACENEGFEPDESSGLHVHISSTPIGDDGVEEIAWFIHEHYNDMLKFGRRYGDTDYCSDVDRIEKKGDVWRYFSGHGTAVNLDGVSGGHFEIRVFNSTADVSHIWAILEFCHCIAEVAKKGVVDITWRDLEVYAEENGSCENFLEELRCGFEDTEFNCEYPTSSDELMNYM